MSSTSLIKRVSTFLGFSEEVVEGIAKASNRAYVKYSIPKKGGGRRTILHPSKQLKSIQYALNQIVFEKLPVDGIAKAYVYGISSPIKKNANIHKDYKYSLRIDFKDFFPSLQPSDIFNAIKAGGFSEGMNLNEESEDFIEKSCFYNFGNHYGLPIGAPSSPSISNAIMNSLDKELVEIASQIDDDAVVTRYADDIIFSVNEKGACKMFHDRLIKLIENTQSPMLKINKKKTRYMSRGSRRVVNGLFITPNGKVTIGREKKNYIKKLVYKYNTSVLEEHEIKYLSGYLSFILDVEPEFYKKLVVKYSSIVNDIRKMSYHK